MKSVFNVNDVNEIIVRINKLTADSKAVWGKMSVDQMLAHCNVTYEMQYDNIHPKPNFIMKFIVKTFIKNTVVGDKPYKKNSQTAPQFLIKEKKDFVIERNRLMAYINKTLDLGSSYFEGLESHSMGPLSSKEYDTMFYKHLDHHLNQFGV